MKRTHHCNELRPANIGQTVTLSGWVHSRRDLGGFIFIDVRDREGRTQTVFDPSDMSKELFERAASLRSECVISVTGKVRQRPEGTNNSKIPTGEVEVGVHGTRGAESCRSAAVPVDDPEVGEQGERGTAPEISLPGSAPARDGPQSAAPQQSGHRHPRVHGRAGLSGSGNADAFQVHAGRRPRIPGARAARIPACSTRCRNRRSNSSKS